MTTFEEQFPSLRNRIHHWSITDYVLITDIEKGCLDKQKVREAITKHNLCIDKCEFSEESCMDALWKELGL